MLKIEFPQGKVEVRSRQLHPEIFDVIRKKWLKLTPEEWVRQLMIQYLLGRHYPDSLMAVEKKIKVGELSKRCDIVVYNRNMQPFMIVECKKMEVVLSEKTLQQILRYHITLRCPYLLITNGQYAFCYEKVGHQFAEIDELPVYPS